MPKTDHYHYVFSEFSCSYRQLLSCQAIDRTLRRTEHLITIRIQLIHHILKFCFCWILSKRSHHCSQLFRGDCTISIFVITRKNLLDFFREEKTCKEWSMCSWDFLNSLKRLPFLKTWTNMLKHFVLNIRVWFSVNRQFISTTLHMTQIERCRWNT